MFKVTARTLLELGSELISSDIIAFYELIKNGFDAGAKSVSVHFDIVLGWNIYRQISREMMSGSLDAATFVAKIERALDPECKAHYGSAKAVLDQVSAGEQQLPDALAEIYGLNSITVSDGGSGMTSKELETVFLLVGTGSRKEDVDAAIQTNSESVPYRGEKGLGRLSAMRLGDRLEVVTSTTGEKWHSTLLLDWTEFNRHDVLLEDIKVSPARGLKKDDPATSGTNIVVSNLTSAWTRKDVDALARDDFSLLFDPFEDIRKRPRVFLYWNGVEIDVPAMDRNLLEHAHARVKGEYGIDPKTGPFLEYRIDLLDLGYDHPHETDIVRLEEADLIGPLVGKDNGIDEQALRDVGPFSFEAHWFNRRRLGAIDGIGDRQVVRKLHEQWTGIRLYRDGFRVFPYGEEDDDWLSLDRKALMSQGYTLNKIQFIGRVRISRTQNPHLIDQTNREGLRVTPEQKVMLGAVQFIIQDRLREEMRALDKQFKDQRQTILQSEDELRQIEQRAKSSIKSLREASTPETIDTVDELKQTLFNLLDFSQRARRRVEEVEEDARQMIDLAGIGLLVEVIAHELARSSEAALQNIADLKASDSSAEDISEHLEALRSAMKAINNRLKILDPLSVSGRNRREQFDVYELVRETLKAHEFQFERHGIKLQIEPPPRPLVVTAVKGYAVQVLENLISNSVYWLDLEVKRDKRATFTPEISIKFGSDPKTVYFADNGPGIHQDLSEKVFELFYSSKEIKKRRGLGLFIARDSAEHDGGTLELDPDYLNAAGRLSRFIYTFSS